MADEHKSWCRLLDIGGWCDCGGRGPTSANNPHMPNPRGPRG